MITLKTKLVQSLFLIVFVGNLQAAMVNGDFSTGDLTGWSTDTDGFPGSPSDFSVSGPNNSGRVEADYWSTPGDDLSIPLNDVFFANTLYQELDTSAAPGNDLVLSFDWIFGGEDGDLLSGEIFLVGLNDGLGNYYGADGNLGFLIDPTTAYGSGNYTATLDYTTFANSTGWFLGFQLGVGVDPITWMPNAYGSFIEIDNVTLSSVSQNTVPEPGMLVLFGLGLIGLWSTRHKYS